MGVGSAGVAEGATEFVSTIKSSGGDFSSLVAWDASVACDLTTASTKVFSYNQSSDTLIDGTPVRGAASLATGTVIHATPTQVLIKNIVGTFQAGEEVDDVNNVGIRYVVLSDSGNPAIAVAETSIKEDLVAPLTLGAWTTSATNYVEIRAAPSAKHTGVVGAGGVGIAFGGTGALLSSGVASLRLTNLSLEATASANPLLSLTTGATETRISGCLINKTSASGQVLSVASGAVKLWNNFIISRNSADSAIQLASDTGNDRHYLYGNTFYHAGGAATVVVHITSTNSPSLLRNNIVFGFAAVPITNSGGATFTRGYNAYTSGFGGATEQKNLTASDHLTNLTAGSEDLHLKATSSLRDAGYSGLLEDVDLAVRKDIDGEERTTSDIGADVVFTPIKEFVSAIRAGGGDYPTFTAWNNAVKCDLTANATRVFAHGGKNGLGWTDNAAVTSFVSNTTGAASTGTGTAVHVTAAQMLMKGPLTGAFSAGNVACVSPETPPCTNYVILRDAGYPAMAVAEAYNDWLGGLDENVTISGWTASRYRYPVVRAATDQRSSLVGSWAFDEASGTTAADGSLNGHTGTVSGTGATFVPGKFGNALSFNGVDTTVSVPFNFKPSLPLTLELWVKPSTATPVGMFDTAPGSAWVLRNYGPGGVEWWPSNPSISLDLTANVWQHLVFVFRQTTVNNVIDYYRNGALVASTNGALTDFAWTTLVFGNINGGGAGWYAGLMDEVRIYDQSFSAAQVSAHYNGGAGSGRATGRFVLKPTATDKAAIKVLSDYTHIEGIEIDGSNVTLQTPETALAYASAVSYWRGNILRHVSKDNHVLKVTGGKSHYIWNNFIIGSGSGGSQSNSGIAIENAGGTSYVFANSITANWNGIRAGASAGGVVAKNNASLGNAESADYAVDPSVVDASSSDNASGTSSVIGTSPKTGVSAASAFTNVTPGSEDLHLKPAVPMTGNPLVGAGADLSTDPNLSVTDDIDAIARVGAWDIGADKLDNVWKSTGDLNWSNAANWSLGTVPAAGESVMFNQTSTVNCTVASGTNVPALGALTLSPGYTGTVTFQKNATQIPMELLVTKNIAVNGGNLIFEGDATTNPPNGKGYTLSAANITVGAGASLNADGKGFLAAQGPGAGVSRGTCDGGGGGYGGRGATSGYGLAPGGQTYGSATAPTALGSGGGCSVGAGGTGTGGGALKLNVTGGTVTVNGTLSVNGVSSSSFSVGGGSGGSLWMTAPSGSPTLIGTGTISAKGGHANGGGGGGGGRIDLSSVTSNFTGNIAVQGGAGGGNRQGLICTIVFPAGFLDTFTPTQNITLGHGLTFGAVTINNGITLTLDPTSDAEKTFAS
ncbi:MAG: LamG domain-containing protein [Candidatus Omnitrophica bacterium]|nr:LamG domain-containing protein [Candidatus Omnitrophota bacterium]